MNSLKELTYKRIIPLTIISFSLVTKWWYVLPIDAPHSIMIGFPLAYSCEGWHTSMSEQYFILEFLIDLLFYFTVWFVLIYLIDRFIIKRKLNKIITIVLFGISGVSLLLTIFIVFNTDNIFYLKRNFEIKTIETQPKFIWKYIVRPENRKKKE